MSDWKSVLHLNQERTIIGGSEKELSDAIRNGADLRIYTEFRHNEHIDTTSQNSELIQEMSEFRVTYLLENRWVAANMTLRQPVALPDGFGPRPSMSYFMYNQNGQQAIARLYLDGAPRPGHLGSAPLDPELAKMPRYHQQDSWDAGTNAPSHNFIYDFSSFRYLVLNNWNEVLSHDENGKVLSGSLDTLVEAFLRGSEIKIGIRGLCADLAEEPEKALIHEMFIQIGYSYYYSETKLLIGASHPIVRVKPTIPMWYVSKGWDCGWLMPRTDGFVALLLYDPYTLKYSRREGQYAIRWFVR